MLKKLTALLLITSLSLCLPKLSLADTADAAAEFGSFVFTDGQGNTVHELTGGEVFQVDVPVETTGSMNLALIVALYDGGVISVVAVDEKNIDGVGALSASLTVTTGLSNPYATVYIWNSLYELAPLADKTTFPSSNADLKSLSIYGESFDFDFKTQTNLNINLKASIPDYLIVEAIPEDKGASVVIDYPDSLPGQLLVTCTASGGNPKTYTFNCTRQNAEITNLVAKTGNSQYYQVYSNMNTSGSSYVFGDRSYLYTSLIPELVGSTHIAVSANDRSSGSGSNPPTYEGTVTDYVTFDISKTADVYYLYSSSVEPTDAVWLSGWTKISGEGDVTYYNTDNSTTTYFRLQYKKRFTVAPGQTTSVSIGASGTNQFMAIALKWVDEPMPINQYTLYPDIDVSIRSNHTENTNSSAETFVEYNPASPYGESDIHTRYTYMRFDISEIEGNVLSAQASIKFRQVDFSSNPTDIPRMLGAYSADFFSDGAGMNWSNKPAITNMLDVSLIPGGTATYSIETLDLRTLVAAQKANNQDYVTIALKVPENIYDAVVGFRVASNDHTTATHRPFLTIQTVPDYVEGRKALLSSVKIDGVNFAEFDAETYEYTVNLEEVPSANPIVTASADTQVNTSVTITQAQNVPGAAVINVTSEDGMKTNTYVINFTVAHQATYLFALEDTVAFLISPD